MDELQTLRTAVIGLLAFAGTEEGAVLARAASSESDEGSARLWAARPLVVHNAEFRQQQVRRFEAIRGGETPPLFPEIDHASDAVYRRYVERSDDAAAESRDSTLALIDEVRRASDDDLTDPSRQVWLEGRQLWLQTVVRGFWHPTGHLGEYYLAHGSPELAISLQARAVSLATLLSVPNAARAMASYNLACAQARVDMDAEAIDSLREAMDGNAQLGRKALGDPDLECLRRDGRLQALVGRP